MIKPHMHIILYVHSMIGLLLVWFICCWAVTIVVCYCSRLLLLIVARARPNHRRNTKFVAKTSSTTVKENGSVRTSLGWIDFFKAWGGSPSVQHRSSSFLSKMCLRQKQDEPRSTLHWRGIWASYPTTAFEHVFFHRIAKSLLGPRVG